MIGVTVLGSTGTIGVNTLDVIARNRERFEVIALTANTDFGRLQRQCEAWRPEFAVMRDETAAERLADGLRRAAIPTEVLSGVEGLEEVAAHPRVDHVMAGIVGAAGLLPTLAAARAGKRVLLANKESLVMSGRLLMDTVRESGADLLPIDSEHNAIFQCLPSGPGHHAGDGIRRILLTGSGGPFRTRPIADLHAVTPDEACAHPNWVMGRKISVDSATMMNKGLEVIEACWLFGTTTESISVVIHPQSVIHSMVEYLDGSVLAQMGHPDMRTPIAHGLGWPDRIESGVEGLEFPKVGSLEFEEPDFDRVPCLRLGYEAAAAGGTAATVLNAANEVAVAAFLDERLCFTDIAKVIEKTLSMTTTRAADDIDTVIAQDGEARAVAGDLVTRIAGGER